MSNPGARVGDRVTLHWAQGSITGVLKSRPVATGDTWVVHTDGGRIYEVQTFESMVVLNREVGEDE